MGDSIKYLGEASELTYTDMDKLYETSLKLV
jgi:hypothetical protein